MSSISDWALLLHSPPKNECNINSIRIDCFLSLIIAYVKSNTVVGDSKHSTGVVMAEIVKANIPVRNGVVHLIHRPLMIVDTTVIQFLEVRAFSAIKFCSQTLLKTKTIANLFPPPTSLHPPLFERKERKKEEEKNKHTHPLRTTSCKMEK